MNNTFKQPSHANPVKTKYEIILASASPRRKEIMANLGFRFKVIVCPSEPEINRLIPPEQAVLAVAKAKAESVFNTLSADTPACVIGSDTVVINPDGVILGKPRDEAHAFEMLSSLSGKTHKVITAVWICSPNCDGEGFTSDSAVTFFPISEEEIRDYIKTGEPMDKAGSYGIQGLGMRYIEKISGDYYSVMGLPASKLWQTLKNSGVLT